MVMNKASFCTKMDFWRRKVKIWMPRHIAGGFLFSFCGFAGILWKAGETADSDGVLVLLYTFCKRSVFCVPVPADPVFFIRPETRYPPVAPRVAAGSFSADLHGDFKNFHCGCLFAQGQAAVQEQLVS